MNEITQKIYELKMAINKEGGELFSIHCSPRVIGAILKEVRELMITKPMIGTNAKCKVFDVLINPECCQFSYKDYCEMLKKRTGENKMTPEQHWERDYEILRYTSNKKIAELEKQNEDLRKHIESLLIINEETQAQVKELKIHLDLLRE